MSQELNEISHELILALKSNKLLVISRPLPVTIIQHETRNKERFLHIFAIKLNDKTIYK